MAEQRFIYVDVTLYVEAVELLDRYHVSFSDDNIVKTVQFFCGTLYFMATLSVLGPAMGRVAEQIMFHRPIEL